MTKENKDLLLKYLCMALPYGVKILHEGWNYEWDDELSTVERVVGIDEKFIYTKVINTYNSEEYRDDKWPIDTFDDKPYLRQMSSMTEEEFLEYYNIKYNKVIYRDKWKRIDVGKYHNIGIIPIEDYLVWLLEHHFDFMGLIPIGVAIEVTKDNNPYKD